MITARTATPAEPRYPRSADPTVGDQPRRLHHPARAEWVHLLPVQRWSRPRVLADSVRQTAASSVTSSSASQPKHPDVCLSISRLAAWTSAREVIRSTTAVRPNTASETAAEEPANVLVRRTVRADIERPDPPTLLLAAMRPSRPNPRGSPAFPQVTGQVVGLGGLEPPASSLSGIEGYALCGPAFSQVAAERQGPRDAF
jgi:hypothetical protein